MSTLSIRSPRANQLARQLAALRGVTITDAVETALETAMKAETRKESPSEIAREILARRGIVIKPGHPPVPQSAYHDLDHDLVGEED